MGSITDEVASSTIVSLILGVPIMIGIGILLIPFIIISGIIGVPIGTLIKSILIFVIAILLVWFFCKHQIIENGIVGLIVGSQIYTHFKIHPIFCILIGMGIVGLLFFISYFNFGFWVKAVIFSIIVSFLIWGAFYSNSGLLPAQDKIWSISFFVIFFIENMYIRLCVRHKLSDMVSVPTRPSEEYQVQKIDQSGSSITPAEENPLPQQPMPTEYTDPQKDDEKAVELSMEGINHAAGNERIRVTRVWDSSAEETAYKILCRKINLGKYQIDKHIALKEIFKSEKKESWMDWHVDFLIEDSKGYPVLGIEINGSEHWNKSKCRERDRKEKSLFEQAGIPLVCIPLPELPSYTKEEYKAKYENDLEKLMDKYLRPFYGKTSYPAYCHTCGQQLEYRIRNDHTGGFYCCLNKECKREIIPDIPPLFNPEYK